MVKNNAPEPKGSPNAFTKVISNLPAILGSPGIIKELMKSTRNKLNAKARIPPVQVGFLYFLK